MKPSDIVLIVSVVHLFCYHAARQWEVIVAFAISVAVNFAVKRITKKPRPGFPEDLVSFYSGHTATAFVGFGVLFMREHPYAAFAAFSLGVAVAAGRVMERRHDFKDVLIGAFGGGFLGAVIPAVIEKVWP